MAKQRVYAVKDGSQTYLVQTTSKAKAIKFIVKNRYSVEVVKAVEVAELMSKGVKLEIDQ
jgi:hypothetical protein